VERIIKAFFNSVRALKRLLATEPAFRQEAILFVIALPLAWLIAASWRGYLLLLGSIVVLMIVEVLNTGIEKACDAVSREFKTEIQLAKDCGSLAVLLAIALALGVWGLAIAERLAQ